MSKRTPPVSPPFAPPALVVYPSGRGPRVRAPITEADRLALARSAWPRLLAECAAASQTVRGPLALGRDPDLFPAPVCRFVQQPCAIEVRAGQAVLWLYPDQLTMFRAWLDLGDGKPVRCEWVTPPAFHRVVLWMLDAAWEPDSPVGRPTRPARGATEAAQRALRAAQRLARTRVEPPGER